MRDADSERDDPMYQFGLMRSDYTAKPAFATYRDLLDELSPRGLSLTTVDA